MASPLKFFILRGRCSRVLTISDKEFKKFSAFIKENYGINLKEEKKALVNGRLHNVLLEHNFHDFSEYLEYVVADKTGVAATTLINKITTNHTFFMREPQHFYFFRDKVLPYLKGRVSDNDLRIWCAGCSSGEEPYTLAMLIDEFFGSEKANWDTKVLATDISNRVLEKAKTGVYDNEDIAALPPQWKISYFRKINGEQSVICEKIRHEVVFRIFNLMEESFPFKRKFHAIFCRNVMIYFDAKTKRDLVEKFYDALEYGGYLFIGHSESLNRDETRFKYIMPAVYRKE